jgi:predicted lipoprotein with Yx(FWY)xxD motif
MGRLEVRTKLVIGMIAAVLLLAACGGDDDNSSTSGNTTVAESGSNSAATLIKTSDSDLGEILTTDNGMTVYAFMNDKDGTPTCTGACASMWPPVTTDSAQLPEGLDSSVFTVVAGADGTHQIAAANHPLYTFANDEAAGDTNGQGFGGIWFVVKPDGSPNQADAGATPTTAARPGY